MPAQQLLSLVIQAVDKASDVIRKVKDGIGGLGDAATKSREPMSNLSNAIAFGMAKYHAATAVAQQGIGKLQGMIAESSSLQLENMSAAQTFAAVTGKSFDEGAQFIDRMNEKLARSAASLPGATKDYTALARTIQDNVIDAFKDANGKLKDMGGFEKTLSSLSESFGVLSAASNVPIQNTALGLTKALGGASIAELQQIQAFEQNPAILNAIEDRLKKVGAKTLRDLDAKARVALITEVGEKFVDSSYKKRAAQTFDGLMQSFTSSFFDPQNGVFGLSRDLDPAKTGVQSAFLSINTLMTTLIGPDGLFSTASTIAQKLGLTIDPMRLLRDAVAAINEWAQQLNSTLTWVSNFLSSGGSLGDAIKILFSNLMDQVQAFDSGSVGGMIGNAVNSLFVSLGNLLGSLDYAAIAATVHSTVSTLMGKLLVGIGSFLATLDFSLYAAIAAGLAAIPLITAIVGAVSTMATNTAAAFIAGTVGMPLILTIAAGFALAALAKAIIDNWDSVVASVQNFFAPIAQAVAGGVQLIIGMVTGDIGKIGQAFRSLFAAATQAINGIRDTIAVITGGQTSGQQLAAQAEQKSFELLAAANRRKTEKQSATPIAARWSGEYFPPNLRIHTAADGFLGALQTEMLRMPANATPVIANSSEAILTPRQLQNLISGVSGMATGMGAFAPQITIQGATDPEATAREVLRYLEIFLTEYQQGQLA